MEKLLSPTWTQQSVPRNVLCLSLPDVLVSAVWTFLACNCFPSPAAILQRQRGEVSGNGVGGGGVGGWVGGCVVGGIGDGDASESGCGNGGASEVLTAVSVTLSTTPFVSATKRIVVLLGTAANEYVIGFHPPRNPSVWGLIGHCCARTELPPTYNPRRH